MAHSHASGSCVLCLPPQTAKKPKSETSKSKAMQSAQNSNLKHLKESRNRLNISFFKVLVCIGNLRTSYLIFSQPLNFVWLLQLISSKLLLNAQAPRETLENIQDRGAQLQGL